MMTVTPATMEKAGRPFLTAEWRNLLFFTFKVPDAAVRPFLPPGCEPDLWEGSPLASIVAFDFLKTRVLGMGIPGFRNFPEWNLRLYLRHKEDRGVGFVKEFVPNPAVSAIARAVYDEPYHTARFGTQRRTENGETTIRHSLHAFGTEAMAEMRVAAEPDAPARDGIVPFVKEHQWGFTRARGNRLARYHVVHAEWRTHRVFSWNLDVDYAALYGPHWSFLKDAQPLAVMMAEGGPVRVYPREIIPE